MLDLRIWDLAAQSDTQRAQDMSKVDLHIMALTTPFAEQRAHDIGKVDSASWTSLRSWRRSARKTWAARRACA